MAPSDHGTRSLLVAWLWPSLLLGVLTMAGVLATGIDYGNSYQIPFAAAELLAVGLPVGIVFGGLVYSIVVLAWALARRSIVPRSQRIVYAVVAFLVSGVGFYAFFSLFPVAFPLALFATAVAALFGASYFIQSNRKIRLDAATASAPPPAPSAPDGGAVPRAR
jgi:hypothetical protein